MTEADVELLLLRAERRLRLDRALYFALAVLGGTLAVVAASIVILRLRGIGTVPAWELALPLAAMGAVFALVYAKMKLPRDLIALTLDRRAATQEQFVTWLHLRRHAALDDWARGFKDAQRRVLLARCGSVDVRRAIAITAPAWSRALWLAVILVLCASLMPARESAAPSASSEHASRAAGSSGSGSAGPLVRAENELPRVAVLSPTELRKLQLIATDTQLPPAVKSEALKELLAKIGALTPQELSPDVRQLLELLRADTKEHAEGKPLAAGAEQHVANENEARPAVEDLRAASYVDFSTDDRAWAQIEEQLGDVKAELAKYYGRTGTADERR